MCHFFFFFSFFKGFFLEYYPLRLGHYYLTGSSVHIVDNVEAISRCFWIQWYLDVFYKYKEYLL